jgi:hypothetical protein
MLPAMIKQNVAFADRLSSDSEGREHIPQLLVVIWWLVIKA